MARFGRRNLLWTVHMLVRSVRKWITACDNVLARLISYVNNTKHYRPYCVDGHQIHDCKFQDVPNAGDLQDSKSDSSGVLCVFGSPTNKKQSHTALPHLKLLHWTQVRERKAYQRCNCGISCKKHFRILMLKESFSAKVASAILCVTCHLIWLTTSRSTFQSSFLAWSLKDEARIGGTFLVLTVLTWTGLFERINLDHPITIGHVRTTEQVANVLIQVAFMCPKIREANQ